MKFDELEKWNGKFKDRGNQLMPPEGFLVEHVNLLQKGSVLDFACGDGRNSIFLSQKGYEVTGADFSVEGLKRLSRFSAELSLVINTEEKDLSNLPEVQKLGRYNNIIVNHYKPTDEVLLELSNHLKEKGILLINTFNELQSVEKGFPRRFCLGKNELKDHFHNLKLIKHIEYQDERGYLDGYIFQLK